MPPMAGGTATLNAKWRTGQDVEMGHTKQTPAAATLSTILGSELVPASFTLECGYSTLGWHSKMCSNV